MASCPVICSPFTPTVCACRLQKKQERDALRAAIRRDRERHSRDCDAVPMVDRVITVTPPIAYSVVSPATAPCTCDDGSLPSVDGRHHHSSSTEAAHQHPSPLSHAHHHPHGSPSPYVSSSSDASGAVARPQQRSSHSPYAPSGFPRPSIQPPVMQFESERTPIRSGGGYGTGTQLETSRSMSSTSGDVPDWRTLQLKLALSASPAVNLAQSCDRAPVWLVSRP